MYMERPPSNNFFLFPFLVFFLFACSLQHVLVSAQNSTVAVDVGVILNLGTPTGKRGKTSIVLAVEDFYAGHGNYSTRVVLHFRDSQKDAVGAAAAAVDLLKNVTSIMGPLTSDEAAFVIQLGNKTKVPVVSFSASSPSLSPAHTPFFVRATTNDSSQVAALAAFVQHFAWREAVPVYEDSEYGAGIVPFLIDALQAVDARVPYRSVVPSDATDDYLDEELYKLMSMQTRVFIVHMLPALGARLFRRAHELGLMADGYVWIVTDGIANVLDLLDPDIVIEAMQGVIGVRPYVVKSKKNSSFKVRFQQRFRQDYPGDLLTDPTVYQLWAYDAVWAVATAVEQVALTSPVLFQIPTSRNNSFTDLGKLGVNPDGSALLRAILSTRFQGLAGDFQLAGSQLQSPAFEIININGKSGRTVGFWTPVDGIMKKLNTSNDAGLKSIFWPGDGGHVPKGWEIPTNGKKLRIAVPVKQGFDQFVKVETDPATNRTTVTGFCIDVFEAVIHALPYAVNFEYIPFANASQSYDELIEQVYSNQVHPLLLLLILLVMMMVIMSCHVAQVDKFDAVVGDTTILADRSQHVDFTMPYTESGVAMIVPVKEAKSTNMWIFLKPLTMDLWLGSLAFFVFTGFVVWVIEHRQNQEFSSSQPLDQLGTIFYFSFSILVFAHKEKLTSNLSRLAVIIWVFVVLILTSSYTASLTSMLTVQQLQPTVTDVRQLQSKANIGFQDGSFVERMLQNMKFDPSKLKNYSTPDQYADALSKGSANGGVDAILDEIPYLRLFLSEHCADYTIVGPTYKTDGFGFVFPRGSPLVPDISRAILNVTEGEKMTQIEKAWFGGEPTSCPSQGNNFSSSSLAFRSFGGLFLITGVVSTLALLIFLAKFIYQEWVELKAAACEQSSLWKKMVAVLKHYHDVNRPLPSPTFKRDDLAHLDSGEANQNARAGGGGELPYVVGPQSPVSISNHSHFSFASPTAETEPNSPRERQENAAAASVEMTEIREEW
ncbi:hypothetical protein Cni_G28513 [Canna indica]|uniref:Ionotropic glutamate receptor C-terminal domain-containing protein n=1 Tax=Canna indica TaxID=4628 RepID=A0AAQ3QSE3_9LILI|nr:hypothetical protein Cni_G28513 [Canna indica]